MIGQPSRRGLLAITLVMVAIVIASATARASGIRTDVIDTAVTGGIAGDFPLAVEVSFESGSQTFYLTRNGEFHRESQGNFLGATIYGTFIPAETGGTVVTPAGDRRIVIVFTAAASSDGLIHTKMEITFRPNP